MRRATVEWRGGVLMKFADIRFVFTALAAFVLMGAPSARADRCDALAKQIRDQIEGVKIGKTVAGVIFLEHPAVKQASLGCSSRNASNQIYASTDDRKPKPEFFDFLAKASALVFTIPIKDTDRGVKRCYGRIGLVRGTNIVTRYRRLDISCTGTRIGKTGGTTVTVSRDKSE